MHIRDIYMVKPVFSFLICSRRRRTEFSCAVSSIYTNAQYTENVQIVLRLDRDDPDLPGYYDIVEANKAASRNIKVIVGDRGEGYRDNAKFFNQCAEVADGDYLIQFVDDALVKTPKWDVVALGHLKEVSDLFVASAQVETPDGSNYHFSFPMIHRKLYNICGYFALDNNPSVDRCWNKFADIMGCELRIPIKFYHNHIGCHPTQDVTANEGRVPFCKELAETWSKRSEEFERIANEYAKKVRAAISENPCLFDHAQ